ncbi:MAG TPA: alginate lyase family protein, partial [Phycisphaeraceae bacterium]
MSADTKASTAQCCVAAQRYAMADDELFESIDPDIPLGKRVRQAYRDHGASAAKSVLAEHYRSCAAPPGWVALAGSPAASLDDRMREQAELALAHVYGGPAFETRPTHQFASPINWLDNPTSKPPHEFDKQWSMRFLAMPWWEALSRAYQATGDERYASEFVAQFLDFRRQHPMPLEPSAWDDRLPLKYTVPEWRTFEIARRLLGSWTNSFFRFRHARAMTDEALCEMLKSFAEMAHHLDRFTPRAGGVSNNWTVLESLALYTAGIFWPEFRQARVWKDHGEQRLLAQLDKQIYPDGVHWELSPSYAMEVLQYYLRYIRLAQLNGEPIPDRVYAPVHRLADSLAYSSVAGSIPAFGDGVHKDVQPVMEEMLELFPDRQDIRWIVTSGQQGQAPSMASCAFPYGGVYVMRSGWSGNDCAMVITAGPHGVAHQHEDCLSFELYAFGDWLIIDPGKYRYNYDSIWRQYMIGSLAHNTLAVDRMGQSRQGQPSTWVSRQPLPHRFEQGDDLVRFQGIYSDGYGPDGHNRVGHVRSIYFL